MSAVTRWRVRVRELCGGRKERERSVVMVASGSCFNAVGGGRFVTSQSKGG